MSQTSTATNPGTPTDKDGVPQPDQITYMIGGRRCIVSPVFMQPGETQQTVGTILLRLMVNDEKSG